MKKLSIYLAAILLLFSFQLAHAQFNSQPWTIVNGVFVFNSNITYAVDSGLTASTTQTQAGATEVVITPNPQSQTVPADSAVSIQVNYESGAVNNSGLGLRLHFDSTQLSFVPFDPDDPDDPMSGLSDIFFDVPGFFLQQVQADTSNFDNDLTTDQFILTGWLFVAFPQNQSTALYTAVFYKFQGKW